MQLNLIWWVLIIAVQDNTSICKAIRNVTCVVFNAEEILYQTSDGLLIYQYFQKSKYSMILDAEMPCCYREMSRTSTFKKAPQGRFISTSTLHLTDVPCEHCEKNPHCPLVISIRNFPDSSLIRVSTRLKAQHENYCEEETVLTEMDVDHSLVWSESKRQAAVINLRLQPPEGATQRAVTAAVTRV